MTVRRPRCLRTLLSPLLVVPFLAVGAPALAAPGDLIATFGSGGLIEQVRSGGGALDGSQADVAVTPSGGLVATARPVDGGGLWLGRYTPDGTLDASFGTGGVVEDVPASGSLELHQVAVDSAGRVVVAGTLTQAGAARVIVRRYTSAGALDATFADDGEADFDAPGFGPITDLAVDATDRPVLFSDGYGAFGFARLTAAGALDATFDGDGMLTVPVGETVGFDSVGLAAGIVLADGRIVATGYARAGGNSRQALVRLTADGTVDATFGAAGEEMNTAAGGGVGIVEQADGKLVVAAAYAAGTGGPFDGYEPYDPGYGSATFVLTRYGRDGGVDPTFGTGGDAWVMPGAGGSGAMGVLQQGDGRLVAYGTASRGDGYGFTAARFSASGRLDTGFGEGGVTRVALPLGMPSAGAALPGGALVLAGRLEPTAGVTPVLGLTAFDLGAAPVPPDPGGGSSTGGGGAPVGPIPSPAQPNPDGLPAPAPPASAQPASPGDPLAALGPITVVDTTTVRRMPTVVRLRVDQARDRVTQAGIRADFELVEVHRRPDTRFGIGDVVAQDPQPGTSLTSSVAAQPRVRLEVYSGPEPQRGRNRTCPIGALARDLRGADLDVVDDILAKQRVGTTLDVRLQDKAAKPKVTRMERDGRCAVEAAVRAPKRPDNADLFVTVREHPTAMSFEEDDWALTAGARNAYILQVVDRAGRLVEGAEVLVDNTGVGASPAQENQSKDTDGNGEAAFTTHLPQAGVIDVLVRADGANDVELWGTAQIRVRDRSGQRCVETITGLTYERVRGGFSAQPTRQGCGKARAAQAGGWNLFGWFMELITGRPPQQPLSKQQAKPELVRVAQGTRVLPSQLALGRPIGPPQDVVRVTKGAVSVISAGSGNVISAGGGNVISAGSGNVVMASGPGVISAGGGNVISAGSGNVISAGGGNVISAGGGNVISAGSGNVISAGAGNAIAVSNLIGGAGGN